jgi:hypothetical protein
MDIHRLLVNARSLPTRPGRTAMILALVIGVGGCLGEATSGNGGAGNRFGGAGGATGGTGGAALGGGHSEAGGTAGAQSCLLGGVTYQAGASWPCGCNTCWCMNGTVASTLMACFDAGMDLSDGGSDAPAEPCVLGGITYQPGESWACGCNTCWCVSGTLIRSTMMDCIDAGSVDADAGLPDVGPDGGTQPPIWSDDSARLEVRCSSVGSFGRFCGWSWGADAAELTPEQLSILRQMTPIAPVFPQPTCDQGGYVITVVDRSGAPSAYWGPAYYANCLEASSYAGELSLALVRALVNTLQFPDAGGADAAGGG